LEPEVFDMTNIARRRKVAALLLGASLFALGGAAGLLAANAAATGRPPPLSLPAVTKQIGFADLVGTVRPAVVNISTTQPMQQSALPQLDENGPMGELLRRFFGPGGAQMWRQQAQPAHALGSGFLVDPSGYVVTNNHVIADARTIKVTLADGTVYPARVVGRDAKTDLALLKVDAGKPLPYVAFGDSGKERVGDWVIAVGNPYGLGGSVSAGIVSALDRNIGSGAYDDYLQIDAPINPGKSGGPLFDQSGHVVGIDTAIYSPSGGSVGIGFAIPANVARDVIGQLRAHGQVTRGWLGVQMQAVTPALATAIGLDKAEGVLVDMVTKDSPAAKAGVRQGDVIRSFEGRHIGAPRDLALAVADVPAGHSAPLAVWRNGHEQDLQVTIGREPAEAPVASSGAKPQDQRLGLELAPLGADTAGGKNGGAVVAGVAPDSPAARSGIEPGDVVLAVGAHKVTSLAQTSAQIQAAEAANHRALLLLVRRGETTAYVPVELGAG
jgi:serine protease Do